MSLVVRERGFHDGLISYASEAPYVIAEHAVGFHFFVVGIYGFAVLCQPLLALFPPQCFGLLLLQMNFVLSLSLHGVVSRPVAIIRVDKGILKNT